MHCNVFAANNVMQQQNLTTPLLPGGMGVQWCTEPATRSLQIMSCNRRDHSIAAEGRGNGVTGEQSAGEV